MPPFPRLSLLAAPGVALRPLRARDVGPFATAFRDDPHLARAVGVDVHPAPWQIRLLVLRNERERLRGRRLDLAVADRPDGPFLGTAGLHAVDWEAGRAEIGFWLVAAARGRGLGSAAVGLLAD